jgi:hypothetical protein
MIDAWAECPIFDVRSLPGRFTSGAFADALA